MKSFELAVNLPYLTDILKMYSNTNLTNYQYYCGECFHYKTCKQNVLKVLIIPNLGDFIHNPSC